MGQNIITMQNFFQMPTKSKKVRPVYKSLVDYLQFPNSGIIACSSKEIVNFSPLTGRPFSHYRPKGKINQADSNMARRIIAIVLRNASVVVLDSYLLRMIYEIQLDAKVQDILMIHGCAICSADFNSIYVGYSDGKTENFELINSNEALYTFPSIKMVNNSSMKDQMEIKKIPVKFIEFSEKHKTLIIVYNQDKTNCIQFFDTRTQNLFQTFNYNDKDILGLSIDEPKHLLFILLSGNEIEVINFLKATSLAKINANVSPITNITQIISLFCLQCTDQITDKYFNNKSSFKNQFYSSSKGNLLFKGLSNGNIFVSYLLIKELNNKIEINWNPVYLFRLKFYPSEQASLNQCSSLYVDPVNDLLVCGFFSSSVRMIQNPLKSIFDTEMKDQDNDNEEAKEGSEAKPFLKSLKSILDQKFEEQPINIEIEMTYQQNPNKNATNLQKMELNERAEQIIEEEKKN